MWSKRRIPDALTFSRLALLPGIMALLFPPLTAGKLWAVLILYGVAALTDFLDGKLARLWGVSSAFGAYWDPFIDKFFVLGILVMLIIHPELRLEWWTFWAILLRDVFATWLRSFAKGRGLSFQTSFLAKAKTETQMIALLLILLYLTLSYQGMASMQITEMTLSDYWTWRWDGRWSKTLFFPRALMRVVSLFTVYTGLDYALHIALQCRKRGS